MSNKICPSCHKLTEYIPNPYYLHTCKCGFSCNKSDLLNTLISIRGQGLSVPSSKNSRINTPHGSFYSKATARYVKASAKEYTDNKDKFLSLIAGLPKPILVSFEFIRGTHHKFDYQNCIQICTDLMVKNSWISDDNADEIIPFFTKYSYDKENPGVNIRVIKSVNIDYI